MSVLTRNERAYLRKVEACLSGSLPCQKSEWSNPLMQALLARGLVRWSTPSHRARYVVITDLGREAISTASDALEAGR